MNFFKRAMASVTRRKGKSLILFAVIFILGNVMAGAIAIDQGTKSVEESIKKKLGAVATVTQDFEKLNQDAENESDVIEDPLMPSSKVIKEIGELDEVNYFDYSISYHITTEKLKNVQPKSDNIIMGEEGMSYLNLTGVNYNEVYDIKNNLVSLKDGRVFEKEDIKKGKPVILISDEYAKENNLRVGDKLTLDVIIQDYSDMGMPDSSEDKDKEESKKIKKDIQTEVIGIFQVLQAEKSKKENKKNQFGMDEMNYLERANSAYTPNDFLQSTIKTLKIKEFEEFPQNFEDDLTKEQLIKDLDIDNGVTAKFTLKTPELSEQFRVNANQILEREKLKYSKIILSADQYDQIAGPVKGMSKISKLVLIISIFASVLIITLVTILFLRDRKHELGIYLALGEKRTRVVGQIVIEVVTVALLAITISVFTGNMLAKGFSNSLIQTQKVEENDMGMDPDFDYQLSQLTNNTLSEEDVIEAYEISLDFTYVLLFYIVGIGVVLVSTVAPLIYIMRLNPKKIMM